MLWFPSQPLHFPIKKKIKQEYFEQAFLKKSIYLVGFFFLRRWFGAQRFYQSLDYKTVKVKGIERDFQFHHAMDLSAFCLDLKYSVHKIYGQSENTPLLVTERTPIAEQTQKDLFQAKEEEMVKR